jgi:eukaryotic-like serine/threonine-protein kinase
VDTTLHDPLVGRVLDGRYLVEARIAVGGMAAVYRAVDTRLDRVLALKVMHPGLAAEPGFVDRFIREAKSVARLDHPNVVSVHDQGTDGTYVYLAMEYIAGCTLRDVLRERGALQPRAALDIMEPVLAGLGAAHRAGLVHRDMKPENVLIADDGRVKVVDFGLVRTVDTNTTASQGGVLGTVSYMAPEQIEHGTTDHRSDVYACGVLLYEMLTGAKPRAGGTPMQVIYQHLNEDVPPPSAAVPGLAGALDGLVAEAAARDAALRPADAGELLARLRDVRRSLTGEDLDAAPPAAAAQRAAPGGDGEQTALLPRGEPTTRFDVPQTGPPRRSSNGLLAVIGALVLIVGIGAGVWYVSDGQFTRTPGVVDLALSAARGRIAEAGLNVEVRYAFSETIGKGHVISSDPGRGERIRDNDTVTLTVSKGPERVRVPDVTGKPLAQARSALRSAGLTPGRVTREFSETAVAGQVISSDPSAATVRSPDAVVALTVSRGAPVAVPDVIGDSVADAQQQLQDAGLRVTLSARRVFSDTAKTGTVAEMSPGVGKQAGQGDTVTLVLSKGQEMVKVPDVEGRRVGEAKQILQAAGFDVRVIRLFFLGKVTNQSPDADSRAAKGSTVTLWVN